MKNKTKPQIPQGPATPPILPGTADYVSTSHRVGDLYTVIPIANTLDVSYKGTGGGQWYANSQGIVQMNDLAAKGWRVVAATSHMVVMASPELAA